MNAEIVERNFECFGRAYASQGIDGVGANVAVLVAQRGFQRGDGSGGAAAQPLERQRGGEPRLSVLVIQTVDEGGQDNVGRLFEQPERLDRGSPHLD